VESIKNINQQLEFKINTIIITIIKMNNDDDWKSTRLTCEYDPMTDLTNPEFDFDALQEDEYHLQDDSKPTRCRCDDSEPPSYLSCCHCGTNEYDYYGYRYKSSFYCNVCALEVCGKLIEKPKYAFSKLSKKEEKKKIEFFDCEACARETKCEDKVCFDDQWFCPSCAHESELLSEYSLHQCEQLRLYAEKHNITLEEALDYQTHCHCCGKTVDDGMFDEMNHQYCKKKCFEHCEDYWYHCFKGQDCKVCDIWEYHARRDSLTAYDIELSDCEPVLAAIDCFQELNVYPQLYESFEDLVEYFDPDRRWRHEWV
jgi:hypothetical protein